MNLPPLSGKSASRGAGVLLSLGKICVHMYSTRKVHHPGGGGYQPLPGEDRDEKRIEEKIRRRKRKIYRGEKVKSKVNKYNMVR